MTRDDIVRMAREAGVSESELFFGEQAIERFAALVAAASLPPKEVCQVTIPYGQQYMALSFVKEGGNWVCTMDDECMAEVQGIAAAIRARGEK